MEARKLMLSSLVNGTSGALIALIILVITYLTPQGDSLRGEFETIRAEQIQIVGTKGGRLIDIGGDETGGIIQIYPTSKTDKDVINQTIYLGVDTSGTGTMQIFRPDGDQVIVIGAENKGHGVIATLKNNRDRVVIKADDEGNSKIHLYTAEGKRVSVLPVITEEPQYSAIRLEVEHKDFIELPIKPRQ